jgi:hypothetical protein
MHCLSEFVIVIQISHCQLYHDNKTMLPVHVMLMTVSTFYFTNTLKKGLKIPEDVNRRTDNKTANRKRTNEQKMIKNTT